MKTLRLFAVIATLIMSLFVLATASFADGGTSEAANGADAIQALPDIKVTLTVLGNTGSWNGDPNKRVAVVDFKNITGVPINKGFTVIFQDQNGKLVGAKWFPSLGGGVTKEFATGVSKDVKCLHAYVDYYGQITEVNELNNNGHFCG